VCQTSCLPLPSTAVILSSAIILSLTFRSSALPSRLALALATEAPSKEKHTADNTIEHNRIIWTMCVLARAQGKKKKQKNANKKERENNSNLST
jgi:ABC-type protease/lipase transport system fused ATPase/permease subunit